MRLRWLRRLLLLDALLLLVLGAFLIAAPRQVAHFFKFDDLPAAADYLIGLWGCALATLTIGYAVAAAHPLRHRVRVQGGIGLALLLPATLLGIIFVGCTACAQ
jgi:hypothetical protein